MKIPRDLSGDELIQRLKEFGYEVTRQTGSHVRLTTQANGEHHITIPQHKYLKVGTLNGIVNDITHHLKINKQNIIEHLWDK